MKQSKIRFVESKLSMQLFICNTETIHALKDLNLIIYVLNKTNTNMFFLSFNVLKFELKKKKFYIVPL